MNFLTNLIIATISVGTSMTYATLGEVFTEKTGILNLGMEGMMLTGALAGFAVTYHTSSLLLGILAAIIIGMLMASIHALLTITFRANQVVSGLAITTFGTGLANFLGERLGPASNGYNLVGLNLPVKFEKIKIPFLSDIPILGAFFNASILTYLLYLLLPLAWWYMYKTKMGLAVRSVGENPSTASAMGINVNRTRWLYTIIGGAFAGLGGACLSLFYTPSWNENMTGGIGWIVIALVIFSGWNPGRVALGTIVFGGLMSLRFALQAANMNLFIPAQILSVTPYFVTLVVLVIMTVIAKYRGSGSFSSPAALGTSFAVDDK